MIDNDRLFSYIKVKEYFIMFLNQPVISVVITVH